MFNRWSICTRLICTQSHYSLYTNLDNDAQQEFSQEFETFTETLSQNRRIFIGRRNFNFWACIFRLVLKSFVFKNSIQTEKKTKKDIFFIITEKSKKGIMFSLIWICSLFLWTRSLTFLTACGFTNYFSNYSNYDTAIMIMKSLKCVLWNCRWMRILWCDFKKSFSSMQCVSSN